MNLIGILILMLIFATILLVAFLSPDRSNRVIRFVHGAMKLLPLTSICKALAEVARSRSSRKIGE